MKLTIVLALVAVLAAAAPVNQFQLDDFLTLQMFSAERIDESDRFLSNCTTDTHVNVYLADFMEGTWDCHIAQCLETKQDALSPSFMSLADTSTVRWLMGPFLHILYSSPDCSVQMRHAFEGMAVFLRETPDIPVHVRVIESTQRLDRFANMTECSPEQRLFYNIVIPSFCDTSCLDMCYQDYISLDHLNRAIAAFELRKVEKGLQAAVDSLNQEKRLVVSSFGKNNTEVAFIDGAVISKDFTSCSADYSHVLESFVNAPGEQ